MGLPDEQFILPLMAQARDCLGTREYELALAEGRQLSPSAALAEARACLQSMT